MEMLKHELYKIFNKKSVLAAFVIFMGLVVFSFIVQVFTGQMIQDKNTVYSIYKTYQGDVTDAKIDAAQKEMLRLSSIDTKSMKEQTEYDTYSRIRMAGGLLDSYKVKLNEIRNNINTTQGYEKKQNEMLKRMLVKAGEPKIYYTAGWDYIIDYLYSSGTFIMAAMILIGLSAVFTGEYSQGMDPIILSSRNGKRKLITAKISAAMIYIISVDILFLAASFLLNTAVYGLSGADAPMQALLNYMQSPYMFSVLQFYFVSIAVHLLGCIVFGMFVLLISSLTRNIFAPFSAGALLFLVPIVINSIIPIKTPLADAVILFSPAWAMKVQNLFQIYRVYNIFGNPILYPVLACAFLFTACIIFLPCIYNNFKNHEETI